MAPAIVRLAERSLNTRFGSWREILYHDGKRQSIALVHGAVRDQAEVLIRVQCNCLSAFVLNSIECDCREQMAMSQEYIHRQGHGLIIWLDQDGRGEGHLAFMLAARAAKEDDISMTEAYRRLGYKKDRRSYLPVANILCDLGVRSIRLLSNNPHKVRELSEHDVAVLGMQPVLLDPEKHPGVRKSYADKAAQGHFTQIPGKMRE